MQSRDFCYWLQGYFEITGATSDTLQPLQIEAIKNHLAMVFVHEIDPSMGGPKKQQALNSIHNKPSPNSAIGGQPVYRC